MSAKTFRIAITLILASFAFLSYSQSVIIKSNIKLPKDSVIKNQLVSSLNGFLLQKDKPNKENKYVLKDDLLETSALLDEMKGMDQDVKLKDNGFYKCYLSNVVKQIDNNYVIQISYIGITENVPVLRASFRL